MSGPGSAPDCGPGSVPAARAVGRAVGRGTVTAFDVERGLGVVTDEEARAWPFHCTAIADGSRTIDVGTPVVFRPVPGHLGRTEAGDVEPRR